MRFALAYAVLLVLLGTEFLLAFVLHAGLASLLLGPAMAAILAIGLMRVAQGPPLARMCAVAGLVWLAVMLGLGTLDPATRTANPVTQATPGWHMPRARRLSRRYGPPAPGLSGCADA